MSAVCRTMPHMIRHHHCHHRLGGHEQNSVAQTCPTVVAIASVVAFAVTVAFSLLQFAVVATTADDAFIVSIAMVATAALLQCLLPLPVVLLGTKTHALQLVSPRRENNDR